MRAGHHLRTVQNSTDCTFDIQRTFQLDLQALGAVSGISYSLHYITRFSRKSWSNSTDATVTSFFHNHSFLVASNDEPLIDARWPLKQMIHFVPILTQALPKRCSLF